jgi:hypothetical protein
MSGVESTRKSKKLAKAAATAATLRLETAGATDITPSSQSQLVRLLPPNRSEGNALTTTVPVQQSPTEGVVAAQSSVSVDPENRRINKRARSDSEISTQNDGLNAMMEEEARNLPSTGSESQRSSTHQSLSALYSMWNGRKSFRLVFLLTVLSLLLIRKQQHSYLSPLDSVTHQRLSCAESRRFLPRLETRSELLKNGRYKVSK